MQKNRRDLADMIHSGNEFVGGLLSMEHGYLHGFSSEEQLRLRQQAQFLEPYVYEKIDFARSQRLLEVGCGVGAQTEILLKRFPHLNITAVDASQVQLESAKQSLKAAVDRGAVHLSQGRAEAMPFEPNSFDSAFICWLLEHVSSPVEILKEVRRVLKAGSVLYATEVLNSTLYLHPYSPATLQYWFAFNDHQWGLGGDPFVGAKLGNYLAASGFQSITTEIKSFHLDDRRPKLRAAMIDYWIDLLLSGTPQLLEAKRVTPELVTSMREELSKLKDCPDSVFFYSCVQARAEVW